MKPCVAQSVDHLTVDQKVEDSNPSLGIYIFLFLTFFSVMSVYVPPEIQVLIFSYLIYSSGKGSEFKMQILESWFKINLKRVDRALATLSQDNYHRELVKLLLAIDDLPHLTVDMRLMFHREIINLHFR